ncbi:toprim domain-containing protein [Clostridium estertheticum]|uniref:toprim domain-containing protein n=1 Tax=Clostridium estertheticum TaxID=238834 RepID=UPI001C0E46F8|nr:toprim domain-containing protein [Clostridium estertheticum]MBU3175186.1 toprim domain-containing protein [Clostridium estertheticum]
MSDEFILGIPLSDSKNLLQILLRISDKGGEVIYDVSDIINGGYFDKGYEFVNMAKEKMHNSHYTYGSTIVITEGSSDKDILEKALNYLYPNQSDLFSFFDYKASNAGGSTSEVIKIVKSFIASKILNKTVVIFDNDTAGREAIEEISKINLPPNIKILKYPDIYICNNYPTIGPQGTQYININGLAASIELYLGDSILKYENALIPIQWIGYRDKIKQYQGQITQKVNI